MTVTSSKELLCFRWKYQQSWYYQLIHIPLSNPNIDVRILAQGYCGYRLFLYGKGGWVLPCINHIYIVCAAPKAMVSFRKREQTCPRFWSGIEYGFKGNCCGVRTYLLFRFQINKKVRKRYIRIRNGFSEIFLLTL